MINELYTDKKNIEFIGFQCDTCDIFGNLSQHKTILRCSTIIYTLPNSRIYFK